MSDYQEYLKSSEWAVVKRLALEQAGHACRLCGSPKEPNVHHRSYEHLGKERLSDVVVLCRPCHELFHGIKPPSEVVLREFVERLSAEAMGALADALLEREDDWVSGNRVVAEALDKAPAWTLQVVKDNGSQALSKQIKAWAANSVLDSGRGK